MGARSRRPGASRGSIWSCRADRRTCGQRACRDLSARSTSRSRRCGCAYRRDPSRRHGRHVCASGPSSTQSEWPPKCRQPGRARAAPASQTARYTRVGR
eukprot:4078908-Prymnesium_polylepis.1